MKSPTKKQTSLLKFIEKFTAQHDHAPSYREIMRALNLSSVSAVSEHVDNCVAAGFLKKVPHAARSLRVIYSGDTRETVKLFRTKLSRLDAELTALEAQREANPFAATDSVSAKIASIKDDIATLKAAAKLLRLKLT